MRRSGKQRLFAILTKAHKNHAFFCIASGMYAVCTDTMKK
uniref:Uncharacterized protein n=1 Tax=Siphoviridae sp. ctXPH7 TaxID=2826367 RepID=A0A8S5LYN3_9CAUD|nr:MAG TPA: hypothetical protein [Siphoviridae sp. ctXPH7]DAF40218.1 MAG TPA: hypothetical protein [Caudoviricetes sp.]DAQ32850.1 MAG TPA: hypothetical protein [Caudoviricetes sp.]DAR32541.1 MAG TPA: hypothetical protein [Caudoviricetes sp.]